jgi:PadR family transcriptional regulator PadR
MLTWARNEIERFNEKDDAPRDYRSTMHSMVVGGTDKLLAQMRRGAIEYCVLALLKSEDRYGFEITRELSAADELVTSEGTVYPLLTRLRNDGLVDTYWQESTEGPPRRYYRITPNGKRALNRFIDQWARFRDSVDTILSKGR